MSNVVTTHKDAGEALDGAGTSANLKNPYLTASDWGWQIDPTGYEYLFTCLK